MAGWPWPLDAVQSWFEGLWREISRTAYAAVAPLGDWIWRGVTWVKDRILEGLTGLYDWLSTGLGNLWRQISSAWEGLKSWVGTGLTNFWIGHVTSLTGGLNAISAALSGLGSSIMRDLDLARRSLDSAVRNIPSVVTGVGQWLHDALPKKVIEALASYVSPLLEQLGGTSITSSPLRWIWVRPPAGQVNLVAGWIQEGLEGFLTWLTGKLQWLSATITGAAAAVQAAVTPFFEMMGRGMVSQVTTVFSPGSPNTIMLAEAETAFKTMFEELEALTHVKKSSLPAYEAIVTAAASTLARFVVLKIAVEAGAAAIDAAHPVKDLKAHQIAAGIMGVLDMPSVIGPLLQEPIRHGIMIPWSQHWASRYTPQIPGPADLIRFVVREVIAPGEFIAAMPLHGFSSFWAKCYWDAHWILPAFGNLVDAFHREIITEGDLDKFIVWHDYSPDARPGVSKTDVEIMRGLIKTLIGRVDLRRGYALGRLSFEDLVERYGWLGYEEDSRLMAEIMAREALAAEIGKLKDNAKLDFVKGYVDENELRSSLKELGYGDDVVEYHVQDAFQDRRRAYLDDMVAYLKDAYVKNYITTEEELEGELSRIIKIPDVVTLEVDRAYIQKKGKVKAA